MYFVLSNMHLVFKKKNEFNRTQAFIIDMRENFIERIPFEEEVLKIFGPY